MGGEINPVALKISSKKKIVLVFMRFGETMFRSTLSRARFDRYSGALFPESHEHQNNFLLAADFKRDWIYFPAIALCRGTAVWAGVRTSVCPDSRALSRFLLQASWWRWIRDESAF